MANDLRTGRRQAGDLSTDALRIGVAWRELRRGATMQRLRELYGNELELGQVDALDLLVQAGPSRMNELADALRVDASTATRTVDRLEAAGMVERGPDPDDARAVQVRLAAKGAAVHAGIVDRRRALLERILVDFDSDERAQLADLLGRLVAGVDEAVRAATDV